jgi:hypothetical protein
VRKAINNSIMDSEKLSRAIDFQSIAIEELEHENYDTSKMFAEDVLEILQEEES